ncbi:hypothetical protein N9971_00795 [bacterium]|nr:hypothetical protein [bacterium]
MGQEQRENSVIFMAREALNRMTAQDWRHLLTVGTVVLGVLGTLLLGGRLQAEPSGTPPRDLAAIAPASTPPNATDPAPLPTERPVAGSDRAVDRALSAPSPTELPTQQQPKAQPRPEPRRTERPRTTPPTHSQTRISDAEWTLQFLVTCESATTDRIDREFGGDSQLHLFPVLIEDRRCTRVCWGDFTTREDAVARIGVPSGLLALADSPIPRRISDLQ